MYEIPSLGLSARFCDEGEQEEPWEGDGVKSVSDFEDRFTAVERMLAMLLLHCKGSTRERYAGIMFPHSPSPSLPLRWVACAGDRGVTHCRERLSKGGTRCGRDLQALTAEECERFEVGTSDDPSGFMDGEDPKV
jgi:hypothetical protein